MYLDGRERDADDLLHAIFDALFECRVPLRDLHSERHLDDRRALLGLEDVDLLPDHAQRALGSACGSVACSSRRVSASSTTVSR